MNRLPVRLLPNEKLNESTRHMEAVQSEHHKRSAPAIQKLPSHKRMHLILPARTVCLVLSRSAIPYPIAAGSATIRICLVHRNVQRISASKQFISIGGPSISRKECHAIQKLFSTFWRTPSDAPRPTQPRHGGTNE